MNEPDPDRIVIENANGFSTITTRLFELHTDPYVLPSQCQQVFYSLVPNEVGWSYVVRYDLRGMPVKYIVPKEVDIEEDQEDDIEEKVHVSNQ